MKKIRALVILFGALLAGSYEIFFAAASAQEKFQQTTRHDVIAELQQKLERGEVQLEYSETSGYLQSVLKNLQVPVSSQSLVFSRTSLQAQHISPSNPRAIFFNDNVYVGWIRGAELLEITAIDPKLGPELYVLVQRKSEQPRFERGVGCSGCHVSGNTRFVAGHLLRSISPDSSANTSILDHTLPFSERWGGWYVTAKKITEPHLGNIVFGDTSRVINPDNLHQENLSRLDDRVDLKGYASHHSDVVALMVLAHQTQMQNMLMWLGYETKMAMREQEEVAKNSKLPLEEWTPGARHRARYAAEEVLRYLLFAEEARFSGPIVGTTNFTQEFSAVGLRDQQSRSLRDFDLQHRLFRYPCSYLVYSEAFDNLPTPVLDYLYRRLWVILTGQVQEKIFANLSESDRHAILEILCETKKNLPAYFYPTKRDVE